MSARTWAFPVEAVYAVDGDGDTLIGFIENRPPGSQYWRLHSREGWFANSKEYKDSKEAAVMQLQRDFDE